MNEPRQIVIQARTAPLTAVVVYEVHAHELDNIERGDGSALHLSLSLTLMGMGVGALVTLLSLTSAPDPLTVAYVVMIVITVFTLGVGAVLGIIWWRSSDRGVARKTIAAIRARDRPTKAPKGRSLGESEDDDDEPRDQIP